MKVLIDFLTEIMVRVNSESPELFKKIQWVSGVIIMIITFALSANASLSLGWGLIVIYKSITLTKLLLGITTCLSGVFGSSLLPVKDPESLKK